jgi:hypothetical protein
LAIGALEHDGDPRLAGNFLAHCAQVGCGAMVLQAQTLDLHELICGT